MKRHRTIFLLTGTLVLLNFFQCLGKTWSAADWYGNLIALAGLGKPEMRTVPLVMMAGDMVPVFCFELFFGISLYQHYCTCSIYYFSRQSNRSKWYLAESAKLLGYALEYMTLYVFLSFAAAGIAAGGISASGIWIGTMKLGAVIALLYTLYAFGFSLLINILSIAVSGQFSYVAVIGLQLALILANAAPGVTKLEGWMLLKLMLNPAANLVLSWHSPAMGACWEQTVSADFPLMFSLLYFTVLAVIVLCAGRAVVTRKDIL